MPMAEHQEFQRLLIEYPDRLARFGYRILRKPRQQCLTLGMLTSYS
ncbi:MAG: hypothetical protein M1499_08835 [Firmicutes bacterium]|nr:hypothetical protein [Bacillota bacterium]